MVAPPLRQLGEKSLNVGPLQLLMAKQEKFEVQVPDLGAKIGRPGIGLGVLRYSVESETIHDDMTVRARLVPSAMACRAFFMRQRAGQIVYSWSWSSSWVCSLSAE